MRKVKVKTLKQINISSVTISCLLSSHSRTGSVRFHRCPKTKYHKFYQSFSFVVSTS